MAEDAHRVDPACYEAATLDGTSLLIRAEWLYERPGESARLLRAAIAVLGRAQELDPHRPDAFHLQGNALLDLMDREKAVGEDPVPTIKAALTAFERALTIPEGRTCRAYNSLGVAHSDLGWMQRLRGEDSRDSLRRGIAAAEQAIAMSPSYVTAFNTRGLAFWELAEYAAATGADPLADYGHAEEAFGRMLRLDPSRLVAHTNLAGVLLSKARWQLLEGVDPASTLAAVDAHMAVTRERFPWDFHLDCSEAELLRAAWARRSGGRSHEGHLQKAGFHATALLRLAPDEPSGEMLLAEVERSRVEALSARPGGVRTEMAVASRRGLGHASRALAISPKLARALAARAVLLQAEATLAGDPEERSRLAGQAREAAGAALAAEPLLRDDAVRRLTAPAT